MNPYDFAKKWGRAQLSESAASQEHFLDICRLVGEPTPAEADPNGEFFTFEKSLKKDTGAAGFADVWRNGCFAWEYKGPHADLGKAYSQLQLYRESLGNPPLLVVCDFDRYEVHTNFNNTVKRVYRFSNSDIPSDRPVDGISVTPIQILRALFQDPESLNPGKSQAKLTEEAADLLVTLAEDLRRWYEVSHSPISDQQIARFIMRMIFCFFACDVGLLPKEAFVDLIRVNKTNPDAFRSYLSELFGAMKDGGSFLMREVPHFNGGLFDDTFVPRLIADQIAMFERLNQLNWSDIEPSIFGTLFERVIDESKRKQLGTHYTSREDIELIVEPVLMSPLRAEWERARKEAEPYLDWSSEAAGQSEAKRVRLEAILLAFQSRLTGVTVLDPACGSGNFLYVSLALLKALEKEVVAFAAAHGLSDFTPRVHPLQLFGIEMNEYAHELAGAVVWIGYLQWKYRNAFDMTGETPILQPLDNIRLMDAIVQHDRSGGLARADWPDADVIVGNPPFLGGKMLRRELGDDYVDGMFEAWDGRVPREADLCCYWCETARSQIDDGRSGRAGLLATQGIRGGSNRVVLDRIAEGGSIFWAQSDREWTQDGAAVRVSMVGFDDRTQTVRELDGLTVAEIFSNLRSGETDVTKARRLKENLGISFMGDTKGGPFDIPESLARQLLSQPNPDGRDNADVVRPWINGSDITRRSRGMWIVDFPPGTSMEEAALYEAPFEYVVENVKLDRIKSKRKIYAENWWLHMEPRPGMREAFSGLARYIGTSQVAKHRMYIWIPTNVLPANVVIAFARDDYYFFGILHSRVHEVWARATGTQLREVESGFRYTPTSTFETFPFPNPTPEQIEAVSAAAERLDTLRNGWLNPPADSVSPTELKRRTLTNLYNDYPSWLQFAHEKLDEEVFTAYGWLSDLADGEILSRLLSLNLMREPT
ncbi:MAG: class I SAM-dependent DNA methyltransferase [Dehalococcoidia bacterium]|nr:class I SAM-dependent DNA methyltransferase [Dehalococcoidia bacterium]